MICHRGGQGQPGSTVNTAYYLTLYAYDNLITPLRGLTNRQFDGI